MPRRPRRASAPPCKCPQWGVPLTVSYPDRFPALGVPEAVWQLRPARRVTLGFAGSRRLRNGREADMKLVIFDCDDGELVAFRCPTAIVVEGNALTNGRAIPG